MGELGEVDVGLIPIWGWGPTLGKGGHLDPRGAAEAVRRIAPKVAIPIHWGTYFPLHLGLRGVPAFLDCRPPSSWPPSARPPPMWRAESFVPASSPSSSRRGGDPPRRAQ